ncbi:hypothetical protein AVKW3434_17045 [Acidovorax sp. SUPP3434]|uniref:hypothetical protein n=1 Tax=Acidovorax sp. SUPP3434 TaxID=2920880 RepID=UPI0023DE40A1|nr:hypothetical protein [Acidovorax sp. SUPP3434]GKT01120.1 hypothetical protein AVKW3434_17045 [Acidovorax sp. SUPP3434]
MTLPGILRRTLRHVGVACALTAGMVAHAGGTGAYALDWPHAGEALTYRSCGCADACWVAEVRDRRTKALKARLRCDCETLHYQQASAGPRESVVGACEPINGSERKPEALRERLELLLNPKPARPE